MNAPNKGTRVKVSEASDADLHANNLTNWQQQYDQTSRGSFYGSIVELPFDDLQVFREQTSQALQQRCVVWPDSVWLGIPLARQPESRINGISIRPDNIMCRPGDCEFDLTTPENYHLYGLVIEQATLLKMADIHGVDLNWKQLVEHGRLKIPGNTLSHVRFLLARLLSDTSSQTPKRLQHDLVMMALLEMMKIETPAPVTTAGYFHRKNVVDRARAFISENVESPITVTQLCEATHVSRRTLQYSFESILGISPIQYLRISRLNGVRRSLVTASDDQTVSDIASQWGFWHLSQFAKDYRQLFGERPSETRSIATQQDAPELGRRQVVIE